MRSKPHKLFYLLPILLLGACGQEDRLSTHSPLALGFYEKGVRSWERFYYSEAKALFDSALAVDSTFAMAWGRLALLNFNTRNEPEARLNIARAVRRARDATDREQLYVRLWDRQIHFDGGAAARVADSLIELYPHEAEALVTRGIMYEENKSLDSAIVFYRRAEEVDSNYARASMHLGYAHSAIGEQDKAVSSMKRYIRLSPEVADPRASYADLLLRAGEYDEALEQYRKSLEIKPDYWYSINQIGTIYLLTGRLREAGEQFERALALLPPGVQLEATHLSAKASLEVYRGKYADAAKLYQNSLQIDSTALDAAYGLSLALSKLGRFAEAETLINQVRAELVRRNLTETQGMVGFHLSRSRVLLESGRLEEAGAACEEALEFSTPISRTQVFRQWAEVYLRQREFEPALDACEEALSMNPNLPGALLTLVRVYRAQGDVRMTREIGERLLSIWKDADSDFQDAVELKRILSRVIIYLTLPEIVCTFRKSNSERYCPDETLRNIQVHV